MVKALPPRPTARVGYGTAPREAVRGCGCHTLGGRCRKSEAFGPGGDVAETASPHLGTTSNVLSGKQVCWLSLFEGQARAGDQGAPPQDHGWASRELSAPETELKGSCKSPEIGFHRRL